MKMEKLLAIDAFINFMLGLIFIIFPHQIVTVIGVEVSTLPKTLNILKATIAILGGVLFGIGIALLIEAYGKPRGIHGLGIAGAIAINFCGAGVLTIWLISDPFNLPLRGYIILWTIAIVVLALGFIELLGKTWKYE